MEVFTILKKDIEQAKNKKSSAEEHVDDDDLDACEKLISFIESMKPQAFIEAL